jgi:DNA polymerase-3 subunit epsilon
MVKFLSLPYFGRVGFYFCKYYIFLYLVVYKIKLKTMLNFAAIDFETANYDRSSVCSVGVVIVRAGAIVDKIYHLIHPEPEWYSYWNTQVHGLTAADTENAEVFPFVWKAIAPKIEGLPLVAHNSMFDESCLQKVHRVYQMDYPGYEFQALVTK